MLGLMSALTIGRVRALDKFTRMHAPLPKLAGIPTPAIDNAMQVQELLLRFCVNTQPNYWLRMPPPS